MNLLFRLLAGGNILNGSNQAGCRLARLPIGGTARIEPLDPAIRKHQPELEIAALGAPQQGPVNFDHQLPVFRMYPLHKLTGMPVAFPGRHFINVVHLIRADQLVLLR